MGELLDALNELDDRGPPAEPVSPLDQAAQAFRSASQRVNEAIEGGASLACPWILSLDWCGRRRCSRWRSPFCAARPSLGDADDPKPFARPTPPTSLTGLLHGEFGVPC